MKHSTVLLFSLLLLFLVRFDSSLSQSLPSDARTITNINSGWQYLENSTEQLAMALDTNNWVAVDLPHSWNSHDATDQEPGYRRSASWYKKNLVMDAVTHTTRYVLYFEGVNINTKVYLNGTEVGGHIGGYIGFKIDISDVIKSGNNKLVVRVDNSYDPEVIPSQKSDFFIFGGITRDVWLQELPLNSIERVKVSTPVVNHATATIKVEALFVGDFKKGQEAHIALFAPSGEKVTDINVEIEKNAATVNFTDIKNPKLWDTNHPHLYTLKVSLDNGDVLKERIGLRWFKFEDHGAFFLNGKRLLLRGTHRHEEHAGVGAAMSNEQHRKDMEQIKNMGANFVRLAHYPQDPEIYKACDELGLIVWDELPWCRGGLGNDVWKTNTKKMLKEMIAQNYNHPSIVFWSLGNEIYWLPDFENGDNRDNINVFLRELNDIAHQEDPLRVTAMRKYYEGADIVDVFSPSIWSGWYSGSYKSYQKAIDTYKKQYKHFVHVEYGGSSHVGRHTENPITGEGSIQSDGWEEAIVQTDVANIAQIGDWSENYIVDLFDWHLRISETDTTFVGNAQWAFKDFGTPLRPENDIPYINQKGLVDRNGHPKDAFYVFKSYWAKEPFAYIESHTWTERQGPKGLKREICVYSNLKNVEFFHNSKSLGEKTKDINKFPASGLTWTVDFVEGKNRFRAVGKDENGNTVEDNLEVNYRFIKNGKAKQLVLDYKTIDNGHYLFTATALDGKGMRCLDYENRVYFQALSGGVTMKSQGTPTGSESIRMANGKASIEVVANNKEKLTVMVFNQNFKGTYVTVK